MNPELQDHHSDPCLCTNVSNNRRGRLVVAFDGTENQFGPESSHVVEFYSRIVKTSDQLSYYTSGIGTFVPTSSRARRPRMWIKNKWASLMARHFKSNLLSGYRFLSDKYEVGDQIFLLGFSRGAYQARVLAAMINKVGLLRTGNNEQIPFAFKMYMDPEASKDIPIVSNRPGLRGGTTTTAKEFKKAFCHDVNIHFVGVWDTVSSVGVFRNKYYPGAERADNICFFRHALALDERRIKFLPEYVVAKKEWFSAGEIGRPRCKEVWFRGYHSDVGGGHIENTTSDNGAIPSRWMAYEAMLAGLEMTPFWGGIKAKDLEPNIGKDSMTRFYKLLEYLFIKWEVHSERHPPLLPSDDSEEPPPRYFSRAGHRKRPRQIFDHQKLHASVCLHHDLSGTPWARLPNSWVNQPGGQYGWTEVINLLRDQDKAARAFISKTSILLPLEYLSIASPERKYFRETVRNASNKSVTSSFDSRRRSLPEASSFHLRRRRRRSPEASSFADLPRRFPEASSFADLRRRRFKFRGRQSLKDSASRKGGGGGMSDQSEVVQNTGPGEEVLTERVPSPVPFSVSSLVSSVNFVEFTLPEEAIEWDLLDCDAIPALIGGVLRGTNVNEFLERLEVLAYSDIVKTTIQESNGNQFISMIRQVCGDKKYAEHTGLAIQVAYEVFWHSDVDLYDNDIELWKIIHSKVEGWNELRMDTPASSLRRAVRLLHKTDSENAFIEIRNTIIGMFNQWRQSFIEGRSAPVQLRFLLETAVEFNVRDYVLHIAVLSSPHFSDAAFTKSLLDCLVDTIKTAGGEMKTLAMLCFCVLWAIDNKATLDEDLLSALKPKFVEVGAPMEEIWELFMPESPYTSHGFGGNVEKMVGLKELLHHFSKDLKKIDCSWAHDALDKALILQQNKQLGVVPEPALPYRHYGGMPSVGGPSAGGVMSGSNMSGGPTAGLWSEWLPSPWGASDSLPLSSAVHPAPTTGIEELPLPEQPEHTSH